MSGKVLLATIGAAHGVRGEVRIKPFTADPLALGDYASFVAGDGRSLTLEKLRPANDVVIAKFRGVDDRDAAEALNGTELFIARSRLPDPDAEEFYHSDLIGLAAVNQAGEPLGTVATVYNFGAGDILDIAPQRGPSFMVPFTKRCVPAIDIAAGQLIVVPPVELEDDEAAEELGGKEGP